MTETDKRPFVATGEAGRYELRLDLERHPFLADHAFQSTVVVPGMLHAACATTAWIDAGGQWPVRLRDFRFERALIAPEREAPPVVLALSADGSDQRFDVLEDGSSACATGFVGAADASTADAMDLGALEARLEAGDVTAAYATLRANRNEYGPAFRGLTALWQGEGEVLARLAAPDDARADRFGVDPCVLDWAVQALAVAAAVDGHTFTLQGFGGAVLVADDVEAEYAYAEVAQASPDGARGRVRLLAGDGSLVAELSDVELGYAECAPTQPVAIAANFTAEPVADAMEFWAEELGMPTELRFAPYNQLQQELLDPASTFGTNSGGVNVALVRVEDWLSERATLSSELPAAEQAALLDGKDRYPFSPSAEIAQLNAYETRYLHKEIFVDRAYCRYGIDFKNAKCVIDVGANIGLFSLFCQTESPGVQVLSFEPSPAVFGILSTNTKLYVPEAKAFNMGLSDSNSEAEFTFYRNSSVFSTFHADHAEDRDAIKAVVKNVLEDELGADVSDAGEYAENMMESRTDTETFLCPLRTVSEIIRQENIDHIDLLKVDAEKSELAVLHGIDDDHWPMIQQVVLEVHDSGEGQIEEARQILEDRGFQVFVEQEKLLERSGLYGVFARRGEAAADAEAQSPGAQLGRAVDEFTQGLEAYDARGGAPILLGLTPSSPEALADPAVSKAIDDAEARLADAVAAIGATSLLPMSDLLTRYGVTDSFDPHGNVMGHVPYTPAAYAALGTQAFRGVHAVSTPPKKVLVLDCDNTLWGGVCGESAAGDLEFHAGHRALQQLAVESRERGMLLCLASKNEEADVWKVFDGRDDFVLRRDHLAGWKIGWEAKSQGLRELAADLNLGIDSFVFVDDNPVELAEVRAACPEVLCLQAPQGADALRDFSAHLWALDRLVTTDEDRRRAQFYDQEKERRALRSEVVTLSDFIESLGLEVDVYAATPEHYERTSQLTQRTNQFNFTTPRCSVEEVAQTCGRDDAGWRLVSVRDRFGDYGIVGAMRWTTSDVLDVDAFLVSCRVLGRGVEHQMLAHLGALARERGLSEVRLGFRRSEKNEPAATFLMRTLGEEAASSLSGASVGDERSFLAPAEEVAETRFDPTAAEAASGGASATAREPKAAPARHATLERIPAELTSATQILEALARQLTRPRPTLETAFVAPSTELQKQISASWCQALKLDGVGIDDDFFALGGSSLLAVRIASDLSAKLGRRISTVTMFEGATVRALAIALGDEGGEDRQAGLDASAERGRKRRARRRR